MIYQKKKVINHKENMNILKKVSAKIFVVFLKYRVKIVSLN